ncbi:ABC transporter substrate-binding protein [Nakamurella lactea]|uniref:ABC transporter substrate-binding protein n=1 Tax=Nakamurella lactea TaxID=459515 RepID=UPI0009FE14F1|nr:ABC transporter substrate-binding protein [Nakamurella lactea]
MNSRSSRVAAAAIAVAVGLVVASCSPAGSTGNSSAEQPASVGNSGTDSTAAGETTGAADSGAAASGSATAPGSATAAAAPSGTFVVARTGDVDKLDPHLATAFQTIETLGLVYDSLVKTDADGKLIPGLATSWKTSDGGKTITFQLRDGVKWQDGDAFTSADVKASIERILDEKTSAVGRSNLSLITSVDAPDPGTAVLHLSAPDTAIYYALASTNSSILHAKDITAGTVGKTPDGTGPFSWKSWQPEQRVTLAANADYWGGAPGVASLEFRVIPSESSILAGMKAGSFQLGVLSDPSVAAQAEGASNFALVKQPVLSYHVMQLNGRRPPLDKLKVRQAIACAVDRQQVIDTAAFGDGQVTGPITSPGYQFDPTEGLPCKPGDLDAAKQLLADAGEGGGFHLKTIVETGEYATSVAEGQNLQAQLAKIGVTLDLQQLTTSPYVKAWLDADYDAAVALNGGSSDPFLMYGRYFTTDGSLTKPAGLESKELNELLVKGNSTDDETVRQQTYQQLQKTLLEQSPWVWMFRGDDYYLVSSKVQGFTARADESLTSLGSATLSG